MVFQSYAVFPHMTVFENIAFGLRMEQAPEAEIDRGQAGRRLLHIDQLLERYPGHVRRPAPAGRRGPRHGHGARGAADGRAAVQPRRAAAPGGTGGAQGLLPEIGSTTIYVTHDQVEALSMGDRSRSWGPHRPGGAPLEVYDDPSTVSSVASSATRR